MTSRSRAADGQEIKRLREAKAWSQQKLADKAHKDVKVVRKAEEGGDVDLGTFESLATALEVQPGQLMLPEEAAYGRGDGPSIIDSLNAELEHFRAEAGELRGKLQIAEERAVHEKTVRERRAIEADQEKTALEEKLKAAQATATEVQSVRARVVELEGQAEERRHEQLIAEERATQEKAALEHRATTAEQARAALTERSKAEQARALAESESIRALNSALEERLEQAGTEKRKLETDVGRAKRQTDRLMGVSGVAVMLLSAAGFFYLQALHQRSVPPVGPSEEDEVPTFWHKLLGNKADPVIVYANADFFGSPTDGMLLAPHKKNGEVDYTTLLPPWLRRDERTNDYTGIAETWTAGQLGSIFSSLGIQFALMPANPDPEKRVSNYDEKDVIFLGSMAANDLLRRVNVNNKNLHFKEVPGVPGPVCIESPSHPVKEYPHGFCFNDNTSSKKDYAVVTFTRDRDKIGIVGPRSLLLLAGNTVWGTWAAGMIVANENKMRTAKFKKKLNDFNDFPQDFDLLLEGKVTDNNVGNITILGGFLDGKAMGVFSDEKPPSATAASSR
jgi:transcriptional regulator with XRE-family HTH domain